MKWHIWKDMEKTCTVVAKICQTFIVDIKFPSNPTIIYARSHLYRQTIVNSTVEQTTARVIKPVYYIFISYIHQNGKSVVKISVGNYNVRNLSKTEGDSLWKTDSQIQCTTLVMQQILSKNQNQWSLIFNSLFQANLDCFLSHWGNLS